MLSDKQFRNQVQNLFRVITALTQDLVTFSAVAVTGAVSAASAAISGNATVGGTLGVTGITTLGPSVIGGLTFTKSSHDYAAAAVAWTLSAAEQATTILSATNASGAANIIATATDGKVFIVRNASGQAITIKPAAQAGVAVANNTTVMVMGNGTDFVIFT